MVMEGIHLRKRFRETEIISLLRAIEVKVAEGIAVPDARRGVGVSDKSCYRWRKLHGSKDVTLKLVSNKAMPQLDRSNVAIFSDNLRAI